MRTVYKARIVPDTSPDGMTEKVIRVQDLDFPIEIALGRFEAAQDDDLMMVVDRVMEEINARGLA